MASHQKEQNQCETKWGDDNIEDVSEVMLTHFLLGWLSTDGCMC